ncbi:MAG TPA: Gfo/Idh/MocA family oxidoreductase [Candidatus Dormibacteraeota bacterium]|jgi:predicted dehydrogenase|nr:Gfo/Idh/MocA family oxidoreductase [Candidatus Dormibacteraeota bacterium]
MTRFGIVGAGWRAEFFLRIAKALPDRFAVTAMAVRNRQRAAELEQRWHVPTFPDVRAMVESAELDFAVVSVPREVAPRITVDLLGADVPVLTETPPAASVEEMSELWRAVGPQGRVQVAEQYQVQPNHAAQIALARSGVLGRRYSARVSVAHGYHGISLIRLLLGTGFAPAVLRGVTSSHPAAASAGRDGVTRPGQVTERESLATIELDGKLGVYDFSSEQYFSRIRTGGVIVRGDRGELRGGDVSYLNPSGEPVVSCLQRDEVGRGTNLEGFGLRSIMFNGEPCYTNPFGPVPLPDEEIAIATCLARMGEYVGSGSDFYPLREALEDQYLSLALDEALATGGPVSTTVQPWAS